MADLLSVKDAQTRILSFFEPVSTDTVPIVQSAGRVLAETISAPGDLPPFANSSMDGFAVHSEDVQDASSASPVILKIAADIPAGVPVDVVLQPGQAARIMTGAPVPQGADAVVPVENTNFGPALPVSNPNTPPAEQVTIYQGARHGENVRPRGQDVRAGQILLETGRRLQPQDVGILASVGRDRVSVYRRPRIALFSSGDELVQPGQPLDPGQIYDSNQFVLAALLEREGAQVIRLGTAPDEPQQIETMLLRAVEEKVDLIVTSAGVSVGAFDFVRQVIEGQGNIDFWRVNMRPGKPLAFGKFGGIPIAGLPGNPVSAYVGCRVFILPVVYKLSGLRQLMPKKVKAITGEVVESDGRESYLRAVVQEQDGKLVARLTGHQGSGNLYSLVQANALLIVPSGVKSLPSGSEVDIWFLDER